MTSDIYLNKLAAARRVGGALPFLLLNLGPTIVPCPIHTKYVPLVLPVDHRFWDTHPCQDSDSCKCWIRSISRWEYEQIRTQGIQDPFAPAILDADGHATGHRKQQLVPIREEV